MDESKNNRDIGNELRKQAEEILAFKPIPTELHETDLRSLIHELQVHQVELEIQNVELRNAQVIIEESRKKYIDLYDYAPVGYFTIDKSGLILEANLTISEMLGYPKIELLGKPLNSFIFRDDIDIFFVHQRKLLSNNAAERCVLRLVKKDHSTFYSQFVSIGFTANVSQTNSNTLISIVDITVRKHLEEDLANHSRELEYANKELESFTYSASHDLNAPLRTLIGFSDILLEDYADVLDETVKIFVRGIAQSAKKMNVLIEDLLRLAKISQAEISLEEVNLSIMASSIIHDLKLSQSQRNVDVTIQENLKTHADPHLLQIVLTNLLGNAWKYTSKKEKSHIEFRVFQENDKEIFFVRDNGDGFDMAFAKKLFVPFQRLHADSDFSGSGIGLAIVDRIITRHKGRIWAEAEKGKGATFYFTLG